MAKRERTKGQTTIYRTLHRNLQIEQVLRKVKQFLLYQLHLLCYNLCLTFLSILNWFRILGIQSIVLYFQYYNVVVFLYFQDFVNTSIFPVLIISYEMFVRAYDIIKQINFDLIICDEGHRLKNTAIKTTSVRSFKSVVV